MKHARWMVVGLACLAGGCGVSEDRVAVIEKLSEEQGAVLARVEKQQERVKLELEALRAERAAIEKRVEDTINAKIGATMAAEIATQVEKKIGSEQEIEKIFQTVVREEMTAYDAQKKADEEARNVQRQKEAEERRAKWEDDRWNNTQKELGLNDGQKEKMRLASQKMRDTVHDMMAQVREQGVNPEKMRAEGEKLRAEYEAGLAQILTPEQLEAYRNRPGGGLRMMDFMMRGDGGHGRGGDRGGGGGGQGPAAAPAQ